MINACEASLGVKPEPRNLNDQVGQSARMESKATCDGTPTGRAARMGLIEIPYATASSAASTRQIELKAQDQRRDVQARVRKPVEARTNFLEGEFLWIESQRCC